MSWDYKSSNFQLRLRVEDLLNKFPSLTKSWWKALEPGTTWSIWTSAMMTLSLATKEFETSVALDKSTFSRRHVLSSKPRLDDSSFSGSGSTLVLENNSCHGHIRQPMLDSKCQRELSIKQDCIRQNKLGILMPKHKHRPTIVHWKI